jgi:hypothetical protein
VPVWGWLWTRPPWRCTQARRPEGSGGPLPLSLGATEPCQAEPGDPSSPGRGSGQRKPSGSSSNPIPRSAPTCCPPRCLTLKVGGAEETRRRLRPWTSSADSTTQRASAAAAHESASASALPSVERCAGTSPLGSTRLSRPSKSRRWTCRACRSAASDGRVCASLRDTAD